MTTQTRPVVYVVDDDQGMLDSTVWLLESALVAHALFVGFKSAVAEMKALIVAAAKA